MYMEFSRIWLKSGNVKNENIPTGSKLQSHRFKALPQGRQSPCLHPAPSAQSLQAGPCLKKYVLVFEHEQLYDLQDVIVSGKKY